MTKKKAGVNRPYNLPPLVLRPDSPEVWPFVSVVRETDPPSFSAAAGTCFVANELQELTQAFAWLALVIVIHPSLVNPDPITCFQSHDSLLIKFPKNSVATNLPLSLYTLYHIFQGSQVKNYFVSFKYRNTHIVDTDKKSRKAIMNNFNFFPRHLRS